MALQFRRGTDAERQQFEFAEGEPIYVTDTGELYIGDGETQGGRRVLSSLSEESDPELGGNLDLNDNNIVGIGNIAIDGNLSVNGLGSTLDLNGYNIIGQGSINIDGTITATGNINLGDGAEDNVIVGGQISSPLTPAEDGLYDLGSDSLRWRNGYFEGLEVDGEITAGSIAVDTIYATDSTVLWESSSNEIQADVRGSVYAQDSGIIVNSDTGNISATDIFADLVTSDIVGSTFSQNGTIILDAEQNIISAEEYKTDNVFSFSHNLTGEATNLTATSIDNVSEFVLIRESESNLSGTFDLLGQIDFGRDDVNGEEFVATINAGENFITLAAATGLQGLFEEVNRVTWFDQQLGIGIANPQATLDVNGSAIVRGNIEASAFKGTIVGDDSTVLINAVDNTITSGGFIQFGSYTDTDRPDGVNGMVIYNNTAERFQGFQNGAWINLDDGTSA